jgi:hypothetical protein
MVVESGTAAVGKMELQKPIPIGCKLILIPAKQSMRLMFMPCAMTIQARLSHLLQKLSAYMGLRVLMFNIGMDQVG